MRKSSGKERDRAAVVAATLLGVGWLCLFYAVGRLPKRAKCNAGSEVVTSAGGRWSERCKGGESKKNQRTKGGADENDEWLFDAGSA